MFRAIVNFSLNNRLLILAAAVVIIAYGLITLQKLPVDVFPDLNKPTVTINIEAGGLAPEEVEQLVVFPIETSMNGIPGVTRVRSVSGIGLGLVFVEFEWGSDIYLNRQLVTERLNGVEEQIPEFVEPVIGPVSSIMGEILLVAMTSEDASPMELRELADWIVRPRLLTIPGVAQVIPIGGQVRQYRITPDPVQMRNLEISIEDVTSALEDFSQNAGGGFIDQNDREYLVRNIGRTTSLDDLKSVTLTQRDGRTIRLDQVADVGFAARTKRGDASFQAAPAVILSVQKQPDIDTLVLTEKVETALDELQRTMTGDIKVNQLLFRQANFIDNSIENLKAVLLEAAAVVAIILFAFLLNFRTTAISLLAIPISILITVLVFRFFGMTINTMTLGGLAIATGELVDDAVVDIENIMRRLKQNRQAGNPKSTLSVISDASQEVRSGIIYLELAQAKARLRARQEIIDVARTQLKVIKRLEATGTIDSTDLTEIQATLSEARIEHAAEAGERDTARIRLAGLIGAPVSAKLDTTLAIETISSNLESQSGLVLRAHRQRLDLISAKQEIEVRKIALKKAKRLFDEDGKELGLEFEDEGEEGFLGPSLSVSVPVFDRGQHRKAKAKAELVEAERRFEALKHAIQTDVSEAHKRVATRRATALAHQNTLIPSTIDRAALAREQFNTGSIEAADFLEAQLAISEARLEAIDAAADYWEARVDLSQAVGGWPAKL